MELTTGLLIGVALVLVIFVPYLLLEMRQGKARGRTRTTWFKPRGHGDIGPDLGYTTPGPDEQRGVRH